MHAYLYFLFSSAGILGHSSWRKYHLKKKKKYCQAFLPNLKTLKNVKKNCINELLKLIDAHILHIE